MDQPLDFQAIAQDLLKALRGKRSTKALSADLGFQTNVVYRWETGARRIPAHVVFGLADAAGLDVLASVRTLTDAAVPRIEGMDPSQPMFATSVLQELHARRTADVDDEGTGMSRFALRRLLIGEATLSMADLLMLAEHYRKRALYFVAALTDPAKLLSTADAWRAIERAGAIRHAYPWVPELLALLRIPAYQASSIHDSQWLADGLGVRAAEVDEVLARLQDAGFLSFDRVYTHAREFRAAEPSSAAEARGHNLRRVSHLLDGVPDGRSKMYSYLAFTSQASLERIWSHLERALSETTTLVDANETAERVYYAMIAFAPLDGAPLKPVD